MRLPGQPAVLNLHRRQYAENKRGVQPRRLVRLEGLGLVATRRVWLSPRTGGDEAWSLGALLVTGARKRRHRRYVVAGTFG